MTVESYESAAAVAEEVARRTIADLHTAITDHGQAIWVLAGGSTPMMAYQIIADGYRNHLDWSLVTIALGDERIGPLDGPDNNWQGIETILLQHIPEATFLRPISDHSAEEAAADYEQHIQALPRFDVVWLGMGEDGHTLSLFPDRADSLPDDTPLVVPVHHSPKPPADRISLTLYALEKAKHTYILATGEGKRQAFITALEPHSHLPIAQAAQRTSATWLTDIERSA